MISTSKRLNVELDRKIDKAISPFIDNEVSKNVSGLTENKRQTKRDRSNTNNVITTAIASVDIDLGIKGDNLKKFSAKLSEVFNDAKNVMVDPLSSQLAMSELETKIGGVNTNIKKMVENSSVSLKTNEVDQQKTPKKKIQAKGKSMEPEQSMTTKQKINDKTIEEPIIDKPKVAPPPKPLKGNFKAPPKQFTIPKFETEVKTLKSDAPLESINNKVQAPEKNNDKSKTYDFEIQDSREAQDQDKNNSKSKTSIKSLKNNLNIIKENIRNFIPALSNKDQNAKTPDTKVTSISQPSATPPPKGTKRGRSTTM